MESTEWTSKAGGSVTVEVAREGCDREARWRTIIHRDIHHDIQEWKFNDFNAQRKRRQKGGRIRG